MLSVTPTWNSTTHTLTLGSDAASDTIAVSRNSSNGSVQLNGSDLTVSGVGTILATNVSTLQVFGGGGGDTISLNSTGFNSTLHVYLYGGDGNDTITGSDLADTIYGNGGVDTVYGGAGNDLISGDDGDDSLHGDNGNDTMYGGAGDDHVYGDDGADTIYGDGDPNWGNDHLGSGGWDPAQPEGYMEWVNFGPQNGRPGPAGNDTDYYGYWYNDDGNTVHDALAGGDDTIDGGDGNDTIHGDFGVEDAYRKEDGSNGAPSMPDVDYWSEQHEGIDGHHYEMSTYQEIVFESGDDTIQGGNGADHLYGDGGDDDLAGNAGNDSLEGAATADGGAGEDHLTDCVEINNSDTVDKDIVFVNYGSSAAGHMTLNFTAAGTRADIDFGNQFETNGNAHIDVENASGASTLETGGFTYYGVVNGGVYVTKTGSGILDVNDFNLGYGDTVDNGDSNSVPAHPMSTFTVQNGTLNFNENQLGTPLIIKINDGLEAEEAPNTTVNFTAAAGDVQLNELNIGINGLAVMEDLTTLADSHLLSLKSLVIANDGEALGTREYFGALDLNNSNLMVDYSGGSTPFTEIQDMVRAGYNGDGGIISSRAVTEGLGLYGLGLMDNGYNIDNVGIAYGDGGDLPLFEGGLSVPHDAVLVKFTYRGDLDLDGLFTSNDASLFGTYYDNHAASGHIWFEGDLNYDGYLDSLDNTIFSNNFDYGRDQI